jgi:uncharacterized protein with gpF-like domain
MKSSSWSPRRRIEELYRRELNALLGRFFDMPEDATLVDIISRLTDYKRVDQMFRRYAETAAERMVTGLRAQNAKSWREAASQGMEGKAVYAALQTELSGPMGSLVRQRVQTNAELISTLPAKLAQSVTRRVARGSQQGARASTIAARLRRDIPAAYRARVKLIARTETSKTSTALTRARSESIGAGWGIWRTSKDVRVRRSHRLLDGVLIPFNNDPNPEKLAGEKSTLGSYGPGECPNCRCSFEPLLRYSQVQWPAKVYYGGAVRRMTINHFRQLAVNQHEQIRGAA